MSGKETLRKVKKTIMCVAKKYGVEIDRVILFGSRARGDFREDSDWDILVITKNKLEWRKEKEFLGELYYVFGKMRINAEVIMESSEDFGRKSKDIGYIDYWARIEGISI